MDGRPVREKCILNGHHFSALSTVSERYCSIPSRGGGHSTTPQPPPANCPVTYSPPRPTLLRSSPGLFSLAGSSPNSPTVALVSLRQQQSCHCQQHSCSSPVSFGLLLLPQCVDYTLTQQQSCQLPVQQTAVCCCHQSVNLTEQQ